MHQSLIHTLFFLIVFNVVIAHKIGLGSLYYLMGGIYIAYMLIIVIFRGINKSSSTAFIYIVYFIAIFFLNLFIGLQGWANMTISFLSLLWIPIFLIFFNSLPKTDFNLEKFIKFQVNLAVIVGVFGIIEFFVDRDIFSLVPRVGMNELYENYSLFYRTRSILFSTQVNALFCSIYLIILFRIQRLKFSSLSEDNLFFHTYDCLYFDSK